MPKGPKGQKRPADAISNAVRVMGIATGEIEAHQTPGILSQSHSLSSAPRRVGSQSRDVVPNETPTDCETCGAGPMEDNDTRTSSDYAAKVAVAADGGMEQ
jgi:hypothetical protein